MAKPTFENLYLEYFSRMVVYVSTFRNIQPHEREDLAHDVLVHAFMKLDLFDEKRSLKAWIYTLARNYIIDYARSKKLILVSLDEAAEQGVFDPDSGLGELTGKILGEIRTMPARDGQIAMMVLFEDLSCAETGRVMSIPSATVRWRLAEIRKRLKKICAEENCEKV